jgi:hypothetical protein
MALMVSGALAILPLPEIGTRRMAMEYCFAFLARSAKIRLRLPTEHSILLLYRDLTKLMYFAIPVKLKGLILLQRVTLLPWDIVGS